MKPGNPSTSPERGIRTVSRNRSILAPIVVCLLALPLAQGAAPDRSDWLAQSQSDDTEVRHEAMRQLMTVVDPRIPDACLSILKKEGNSVKRLAARAIGSHWRQIPKERVPVFTAALKEQLDGEHEGLVNMARRGIALLNRDYDDAMVSRSPNKRWVVYERHGLPCLIDTGNESEELLGAGAEVYFRPAYSNREVVPSAVWHPSKQLVALEIIEDRHHSTLWVWEHKKGLRQFQHKEVAKALGIKDAAGFGIFFTSIVGWTAEELEFTITFSVQDGEESIDHDDRRILWNPVNGRFKALPDDAS
jgi:hypothetical protein